MLEKGITPDEFSWSCLLRCSRGGESVVETFEEMVSSGMQPSELHWKILVNKVLEDREGNVTTSLQRILTTASSPKQLMNRYDMLIRKLAQHGDLELAVDWFNRASAAGVWPSLATTFEAAKASLERGSESQALWWLQQVKMIRSEETLADRLQKFIHDAVLTKEDHLVNTDALERVDGFFKRLGLAQLQPADVPYDALILAHARAGHQKDAAAWLDKMVEVGLSPSLSSYNELIRCAARAKDVIAAKRWFARISSSGRSPDLESFKAVASAFASKGDVASAVANLQALEASNLKPDEGFVNSMVQTFCNAGDSENAEEWFQRLLSAGYHPNVETSYALVRMFVEVGSLSRAFELASSSNRRARTTWHSARLFQGMWSLLLKAFTAAASPDLHQIEKVAREMQQRGFILSKEDRGLFESALGQERKQALFSELGWL